MKMILALLFLGACVYAQPPLSAPSSPPPYLQLQSDINKVVDILYKNVISMDGKIPDLQDPRRHYTEIVYVLYNLALSQSGCVRFPYEKFYQKFVSEASGEAINEPQQVIDETKESLEEFRNKTDLVEEAILKHCTPVTDNCEKEVHKDVSLILGPIHSAGPIYVAGGKAAKAFLVKHEEFLAESVQHTAHQYVVDGAAKLKGLVEIIADFFRVMRPVYPPYRC